MVDGTGVVGTGPVNSIRLNCAALAWGVNGAVTAATLSVDQRTLYLAGSFTQLAPSTGPFVALNATGSDAVEGTTPLTGEIRAVASDGAGGWFVAPRLGDLYSVVSRIDANGQRIQGFAIEVNGPVEAMAFDGARLHVGGTFGRVAGVRRQNYAVVEVSTQSVLTQFPEANRGVAAIAVGSTQVYLSGYFDTLGSQSRIGLAAVDRNTGALLPWDPQPASDTEGSSITALMAQGNGIYIAGGFTRVGGQMRKGLARLDPLTGAADSWNPGLDAVADDYCSLLAAHGVVYVGGRFTRVGGQSRVGIAALDTNTGLATAWDARLRPVFTDPPSACRMAASADRLFITGRFSQAGGADRQGLAALAASNATATPYAESQPSRYASISWLGWSGDRLWAAGDFTVFGGVGRPGTAALDLRTGRPLEWAPVHRLAGSSTAGSGGISQMLHAPGGLVLAGTFDEVNGVARMGIAAVEASGSGALLPWLATPAAAPTVQVYVSSLALDGETLYFGGSFETVAGQARNGLAAVNASRFDLSTWSSPLRAARVDRLQAVDGMLITEGSLSLGRDASDARRLLGFSLSNGQRLAWEPDVGFGQLQPWAVLGRRLYFVSQTVSLEGAPYPVAAVPQLQPSLVQAWPQVERVGTGSVFASDGQLFVGTEAADFTRGILRYEVRARDPLTLARKTGPNDLNLLTNQTPNRLLTTSNAYVFTGRFTEGNGRPAGGVLVLPR